MIKFEDWELLVENEAGKCFEVTITAPIGWWLSTGIVVPDYEKIFSDAIMKGGFDRKDFDVKDLRNWGARVDENTLAPWRQTDCIDFMIQALNITLDRYMKHRDPNNLEFRQLVQLLPSTYIYKNRIHLFHRETKKIVYLSEHPSLNESWPEWKEAGEFFKQHLVDYEED